MTPLGSRRSVVVRYFPTIYSSICSVCTLIYVFITVFGSFDPGYTVSIRSRRQAVEVGPAPDPRHPSFGVVDIAVFEEVSGLLGPLLWRVGVDCLFDGFGDDPSLRFRGARGGELRQPVFLQPRQAVTVVGDLVDVRPRPGQVVVGQVHEHLCVPGLLSDSSAASADVFVAVPVADEGNYLPCVYCCRVTCCHGRRGTGGHTADTWAPFLPDDTESRPSVSAVDHSLMSHHSKAVCMSAVVVGSGIIGLASAYYLQKRGVDTVVLDKSTPGTGSTGRANGGIRAQFSSPINTKLSQESIEVWKSFEEQFDTEIGYRRPGYLFLARRESTAEILRENVRKQNELGVDSEFVSPDDAAVLCPELNAEQYRGGAYCAGDGFADPNLGLQGFLRGATDLGADVRTGVEVLDVLRDGERVSGVRTDAGDVEAEFVVNAAGPWAAQVGALAGLDLPVSPRRRQLVIVEPETPVDDSVPFTVDLDESVHFRPERNGAAVVGGHFAEDAAADPDAYKRKMDQGWAIQALEQVSECAEYFGPETRVKHGWAGLYAVTPDHHPIIEESLPGFVNVVGFSGHGFMHSPAVGQVVAELVADGETSLVDVSELTAARFEHGNYLQEGTVID